MRTVVLGQDCEIECRVRHVTDKAFFLQPIDEDVGEETWFPKSQIDWCEPAGVNDVTTFYIPQWLMDKKGWEY